MENTAINKEHYFSLSFVLSRVLNSGVIMSIEKNEGELKGLKKSIAKITKRKHVVLCNSYTGAVHAALWGQDIVRGSSTRLDDVGEQERKFLNWLGVELNADHVKPGYKKILVSWENLVDFEKRVLSNSNEVPALVLDFTSLGFGPCAALAANDEEIARKAERLIIFGASDLRTMWTQEESDPDIQPGIQFNYRLSPLVAACVKLSLLRRHGEK